eukprot:CAMPEP_0168616412 /NCGR_PEP_ID=MMETSP0449_2-20121227/5015_1 /TAXON_ID=1082188 /ORGANISM="Strombidium rassoulzadegani, Strain ras09" /LENGTH=79 /DNA_ID=CAMNT_0008657199 /DNA_START=663 /DNA_END=899 /DNA_ORIENTATION=-
MTQLFVLFVFCPPGPKPLLNFSSRNFSGNLNLIRFLPPLTVTTWAWWLSPWLNSLKSSSASVASSSSLFSFLFWMADWR